MSHVRPKENLEMRRQTMDRSDMREHLVPTLKSAYKKINSLNATTRKINAVMAILFMRRDKAKTDVESLARRLSAKITLLQSTFEKEIAEIVDKKVKAMEEQNQFVFDKICSLGEVCVEAEKVLKIQNEDKLAKDGEYLTKKFQLMLDDSEDGDDISDLEDSMFIQFIPGDLEGRFSKGTFGQIYSSNRDSGISFTCANSSSELGLSVSSVSDEEDKSFMETKSLQSDKSASKTTKHSFSTESSLLGHDGSDDVPCPPGFEGEYKRNSPPFLHYVSRPPNKALAQSTPVGKETKVHEPERQVFSEPDMFLERSSTPIQKTSKEDDLKWSRADSRKEAAGRRGSTDNMKLPVIVEKWEEEMCEIQEMSSAMSVRLRKNIYDRMKPDQDEIEPEKYQRNESHSVQEVAKSSSQESWNANIPRRDPSPVAARSKSPQGGHVRRLFENQGSGEQNQGRNQWESALSMNKPVKDNSQTFECEKSPFARQSLKNSASGFHKKMNNLDDWWDAPVNETKTDSVSVKSLRKTESKNEKESQKLTEMVDNWEELEMEHIVRPNVHNIESNTNTTNTQSLPQTNSFGSFDSKNLQRPVSPSVALYSWGSPKSEADSQRLEESKLREVDGRADQPSNLHPSSLKQIVDVEGNSESSEGESRNESVRVKKASSIISGRMKNLLKNYIESNKENLSHADHSRSKKSSDLSERIVCDNSNEIATNVSESYKSKLMKDATTADKPDKPKSTEETTLTTLGTVPLKSKPPEKSELRKNVPKDEFGTDAHNKLITSESQGSETQVNVKVKPDEQFSLGTKSEALSMMPKTEKEPQTNSVTETFAAKTEKQPQLNSVPETSAAKNEIQPQANSVPETSTAKTEIQPQANCVPETSAAKNEIQPQANSVPETSTAKTEMQPQAKSVLETSAAKTEMQPQVNSVADISASESHLTTKTTPPREKSDEAPASGTVCWKRFKQPYTDLAQLVFTGNSWSELSAKLVKKIGHLEKGEGEGFFFPIGVGQTSEDRIIVADNGNNLVKIIKDGVFERTLGGDVVTFNHPSAVVVNEKDEIYVKDNTGIFKFDLSGNLLLRIGQKLLRRPYGLALTYNGYLVTLDVTRTNHLLYLFNQDGTVYRSNIFGPLMNNMLNSKCRFMEVYKEKVLVSDLGLSVMYLGNLFGQVFRCFGYLGSAPGMLREPSGVTVDSAGNWIIADSKNDRIQVFSPNGQFLFPIKLSEPIYRPSDIMLTPDRHLLIVNYLTHSIKVYKLG